MRRSIGLLTIAATLLFLGFAGTAPVAQAQDGKIWVPPSSIERPGDAGVRAHTNLIVAVHNDASKPGPTWETPGSIACVYNLVTQVSGCPIATATTLPTGGARAIALVDAYDNPDATTDINTFSSQFGLPAPTFNQVYASGHKPANNAGGWSLEEALDIEWAHAMAPNAVVYLVEADSNSFQDLYTAEQVAGNLISAAGGGEISNSWSGGEYSGQQNDEHTYFSTPGVVYFASTGDCGFCLGVPSTFASVVAAGGTSLKRSNGNFTGEWWWTSGGGGLSTIEARPPYQNGISGIVGSHRGVPDISSDADPASGVAMYDADGGFQWIQVGGTSVSSPTLAGIVNAAGKFAPSTKAELTNLYKEYANSGIYAKAFRDITQGNSQCKVGWDICTGIGAPITYKGK